MQAQNNNQQCGRVQKKNMEFFFHCQSDARKGGQNSAAMKSHSAAGGRPVNKPVERMRLLLNQKGANVNVKDDVIVLKVANPLPCLLNFKALFL